MQYERAATEAAGGGTASTGAGRQRTGTSSDAQTAQPRIRPSNRRPIPARLIPARPNGQAIKDGPVKFNHLGIPTAGSFDGEIPLPHLKMTVSDHQSNPFGIQWQRYWDDAPYPDLVKTVPHVAFEVDDLTAALEGQHVIIEPNSPSRGVLVAFVEVSGAPVELMQIDHEARPDL
jgi:hypothetical protein